MSCKIIRYSLTTLLVFIGFIKIPAIESPVNFSAKGYEIHSFIQWNKSTETSCAGYKLYISKDSVNFSLRKSFSKSDTCYTDFISDLDPDQKIFYRLTAIDNSSKESSPTSIITVAIKSLADDELLTMVQEATFRYFWDFAHPVSGLIREGSFHGTEVCSVGGTGFGLMAILVGIERGFITKEQGFERIIKMVNFLEKADRFHGAWPHWLNGSTGKVISFSQYDNGGDLVETSYLIQGLITVRQYFNDTLNVPAEKSLYHKVDSLWATVEWDWYRQNFQTVLYWHWSPNYGWKMNFALRGYMETIITYILAVASPKHGIPAGLYKTGWAGSNYKNERTFYGYQMDVGPDLGGPLFWEHYSFQGFDPRSKKDAYTNYFRNSKAICLIDWEYCRHNPKNFVGYNDSCWGLTASFEKDGYSAHDPNNDNGTIAPTAALSSIPYVPEQSMAALKYFYRKLGRQTWGNMGFVDAFNLKQNWNYGGYIAIDQGPIINMIENYRTGLLWEKFMSNPEIQPALEKIGFVPDTANSPIYQKPNAINGMKQKNNATIELQNIIHHGNNLQVNFSSPKEQRMTIDLLNLNGQILASQNTQKYFKGNNYIEFSVGNLLPGLYLVRFTSEKLDISKKLVLFN